MTPSLPRLEEIYKSQVISSLKKSRGSGKDGTLALSTFESPNNRPVPPGPKDSMCEAMLQSASLLSSPSVDTHAAIVASTPQKRLPAWFRATRDLLSSHLRAKNRRWPFSPGSDRRQQSVDTVMPSPRIEIELLDLPILCFAAELVLGVWAI